MTLDVEKLVARAIVRRAVGAKAGENGELIAFYPEDLQAWGSDVARQVARACARVAAAKEERARNGYGTSYVAGRCGAATAIRRAVARKGKR